jgi:hypothetical protein
MQNGLIGWQLLDPVLQTVRPSTNRAGNDFSVIEDCLYHQTGER